MTTKEITTRPCIHCRVPSKVTVPLAGLTAYENGALIQDAFPEMSVDDRELLITGIHPECWDIICEEDDEE